MNHNDDPTRVKRNCPLCGHEATYLSTNFGSDREFDCQQCKTFLISAGIEDRLINSPKSLREELSRNAINTPPKMILYICIVNNKVANRYKPIHN